MIRFVSFLCYFTICLLEYSRCDGPDKRFTILSYLAIPTQPCRAQIHDPSVAEITAASHSHDLHSRVLDGR